MGCDQHLHSTPFCAKLHQLVILSCQMTIPKMSIGHEYMFPTTGQDKSMRLHPRLINPLCAYLNRIILYDNVYQEIYSKMLLNMKVTKIVKCGH